MLPDGFDADRVRRLILDRYNMSLGAGLGRLAGRVFRIGHLGISVTWRWPGPCAGWRWGWPGREYRSLATASARHSTTSGRPPDRPRSRAGR